MSDQPLNGAELLAEIQPRLRETATWICLRPDLTDAWEAKDDELTRSQAEDAANGRLGSGVSARTKKLAKEVRELEGEIEKAQIRFVFRAIPKVRYSEITERHPPRDKNYLDMTVGYNREAVDNDLVLACLIDPVFDEQTWQQFLEICNPSEWDHLTGFVREVNGVVTNAPKSVAASAILDKPAGASRQRKRGG